MTSVRIVFALVLVMVAVLLAAGYIEENSVSPLAITGSTNIIVQGATSAADLETKGVSHSGELTLPKGVSRFDLVTFDIPVLREKIKLGNDFPVRIRGKEYHANITWSDLRQSKDGIISFGGKFASEKYNNIYLTVGPDVVIGYVNLNNEYLNIGRAENSARAEYNSSPLHYIYSSNDVGPFPALVPSGIRHVFNAIYRSFPFGHEGGLCGGGFEVYEFFDDRVPNGTAILLTEKDFNDFPQLGAVIRGGQRTKATCSLLSDRYAFCIGGGAFGCREEILVGKYRDQGSEGLISGSGVTKYLVYNGKYYYLRITAIA